MFESLYISLVIPDSEHPQQPAESNIYYLRNVFQKVYTYMDCSHYAVAPYSIIWLVLPSHMHPSKRMTLLKQEIATAGLKAVSVLPRVQSKKESDWGLVNSWDVNVKGPPSMA